MPSITATTRALSALGDLEDLFHETLDLADTLEAVARDNEEAGAETSPAGLSRTGRAAGRLADSLEALAWEANRLAGEAGRLRQRCEVATEALTGPVVGDGQSVGVRLEANLVVDLPLVVG